MERKGGRGLPRAQGDSPFLWIDLTEEQSSRGLLLRAPDRDNLGLSRGSRPPPDDHLCAIHPPPAQVREGRDPRGCSGAVGRRRAACLPGKDKQQVLGCSAPGALNCNSKAGSECSLAPAPAPEGVTKQQGTTELSNVPLPKSAAETSKGWWALPQHLGRGPSLEPSWISAPKQQLFCFGHNYRGHGGRMELWLHSSAPDSVTLLSWFCQALQGKAGERLRRAGPTTAALFPFFLGCTGTRKGGQPPLLLTQQTGLP